MVQSRTTMVQATAVDFWVRLWGANLWLALAALPVARKQAFGNGIIWIVVMMGVSLVVFGYGIRRRSHSVLLAAYPGTLGLFSAVMLIRPSPSPFWFVSASISLLGYLVTAAKFLARAAPQPSTKVRRRPLVSRALSESDKQGRTLGLLTTCSVLLPAMVFAKVMMSFRATSELATGRAGAFQGLVLVASSLILFFVFSTSLRGVVRRPSDSVKRRTVTGTAPEPR
jgi:hypothetical protein